MKTLKEQLNESIELNESVLGIAGGIVAGIIGYKVVKGIIKGLASVGAEAIFKNECKKMEQEYIPKMEKLLQKYPNSYKWAQEYYNQNSVQGLLDRTDGTLGQSLFTSDCFEQDDWTEEDKKEFEKLWDRSASVNKIIRKKISQDILKSFNIE